MSGSRVFWGDGPSCRSASPHRNISLFAKKSLSISSSDWDGKLSNLLLPLLAVPLTPNTYTVLGSKPEGLVGNLKRLDIFSGPRAEFKKGKYGILIGSGCFRGTCICISSHSLIFHMCDGIPD